MARSLSRDRALVLFSGGQDSAVCLAWALDRFAAVETVGFAYGQRHEVELAARARVRAEIVRRFPAWGPKLGPDEMVDLSALGALSETALTRETAIAMDETGLPNTFVPGRNLAFLVFAGALAYRRDCGVLVGGMCETDYSGYPDCRRDALDAQEAALRLGMESDLEIATPLMALDKADTWALAEELGGAALIDLILEETHTCYRGVRAERHAWGYGCGECPACVLRARGWSGYLARRAGGGG
ncbi:MAG: 7-cyano-7-deazaguanine synthase QueC [Pseudomonadota bacterium]